MVQPLYAAKKRPSLTKTILLAGLVAGTLDALFAIASFTISTHSNPVIIFWYIASGALKSEPPIKDMLTATAGTQTGYAIAGVLFHYFIAYSFTAFMFVVYPMLKKAFKNFIIIAIVYGIFVWLIMNYITLPLAFNGQMPAYTLKTILGVSYLIVAFGFVAGAFAAKYYRTRIR